MTTAASRNPRTPSAAAPAAPGVRRLRVVHDMRYDEDVELAHHLVHLRPRETPWQRVHDSRLEIDPPPQCDPVPPLSPNSNHGPPAGSTPALHRGGCRDFAHVMVGAMRSLGLAARYVSGQCPVPPPGRQHLVGADATHARVDAWCPVHGWVALDPANATPAGLDHVTVAWGRDYADVAPLRGVIRGGGQVLPRVAVTAAPLR